MGVGHGRGVETEAVEMVDDERGGAVLFEGELGVRVQVAAVVDELVCDEGELFVEGGEGVGHDRIVGGGPARARWRATRRAAWG